MTLSRAAGCPALCLEITGSLLYLQYSQIIRACCFAVFLDSLASLFYYRIYYVTTQSGDNDD